MEEIILGSIVAKKRREQGITQEQLALHLGVTKASVSKWENDQSYPDVTLLPQLAAYFDMSVDDMLGYTQQLSSEEIERLYRQMASDFANLPFNEAFANCEAAVKKYYSCHSLLVKIALLYINHTSLAQNEELRKQVLERAAQLCKRVMTHSNDPQLMQAATLYQALCYLTLGKAEEVLELLGSSVKKSLPSGMLIAQAYQLLGSTQKAEESIQVELYQEVMATFQLLMIALQNNLGDISIAEEVYLKAVGLAELFDMRFLNPNNVAMLYAMGAQMYQIGGSSDRALELLSKYVEICTNGFFPVSLHGDDFFSKIDAWLESNADFVPRDDKTIKKSMLNDVLLNPIFEPLAQNPEYLKLVQTFKTLMEIN